MAIPIIGQPKRKQKPVQCGFCPRLIYIQNEPDGVLYQASGKPICVVCRIVKRGKMGKAILADKKRYKKDFKERDKLLLANENKRVRELATKSNLETN